jgi:DNA-binding response OmpR family regulator
MAIIILTGNSAECTAIEALNRGADAFLVKPFKVVELRKMIEETLAKQEEVGFRQALISAYFRIGRAMAISKSAFEEANKAICDTIEAGEANGVILDAYEKGCQSV